MASTLFSQATLDFLAAAPTRDLAWLRENRRSYEEHLLQPLKSLVHALVPCMQAVDPALQGSPSRIQRDLRFHPDQPPLRGSAWLVFQNRGINPEERPAFFFEIYPNRWRYGMGFYAASSAKMDRFRQAVDTNPARFQRIVAAIPNHFSLMGDLYKRSRAGHLPEPVRTWYDRKSFWIQVERPVEPVLFSPALPGLIEAEWAHGVELYRFLVEVAS